MPKFASERFLTAILAAGLFAAHTLQAQNKYDVLARVLQPYGALFYSKATTKAMEADVILRQGPPSASAILNQPLRVILQMPDKLRIELLDPQHRVVFCRNGQKLWVYPRDILAGVVATGPRSARPRKIPDFHLPLKDQQIVWIPALFEILRFESGPDDAGAPTWVLDFQLAPEFAQLLKCDAWTASAIVKQSDFQVRHLRIESSSWAGALDILACRFQTAFPPQTWEPDPELANEATAVPPELFDSALERIATIAIPR
jgi:outer membrane lipoprotein-sorting protein